MPTLLTYGSSQDQWQAIEILSLENCKMDENSSLIQSTLGSHYTQD